MSKTFTQVWQAAAELTEQWPILEAACRGQHLTQAAELTDNGVHGASYEIRAILTGPSGASAIVVSVWFVRHGESAPRFVTAYPGGKK